MKRLSRRTILRGAGGIALGLPLLEAMGGRPAGAQSAASPRRIIFVFQANGDQVSQRFAATGETDFQLGEFLAPLEPYRNEILILNRLNKLFGKLPAAARADNHEQGGSSLAPWPSGQGSYPIGGTTDTVGYVLGPSADYAIGDRVLAQSPSIAYRHLVYRVGGKQNNIWNLHSHAGPVGTQNPVPPETDPYAAYARLFSFGATDPGARSEIQKRLAQKQSALDLVLDEANTLRGRLGAKDREKLDLHTQSLRDIERTLQTGSVAAACAPVDLGAPIDPYNDDNHALVGGLFFKIMSLALACDVSRSIQFNWSGNTSNRVYKNLGLSEGHHDISHNSADDAFAKIRAIHKHLWTQNTALYQALKAIPEGDGTLWDHTLIVHWNELAQGDTHAINDSMVILAGGAHGYFRRGRYLDFNNQASFADMLVSCFQYMGFDDTTGFGDPVLQLNGALQGLT